MTEIQYVGETLIYGQAGNFMIVLAFVSSLLTVISLFWFSLSKNRSENQGLLKLGKYSFTIHAVSVFGIMGLLLYMMSERMYEYYYVWQHVSDDLSMKYILSAFWEGQEGSFLLWMFWHAVLGLFLMKFEKKFLPATLATLSLMQVLLGTMILGIYIFETRVGINPFVLLRDEINAPIFANADYLLSITGNGLNPLLQNYWMTIHPPTLFLGFAAMTIPFCFSVAAFIDQDHKGWLKPVLPWAFFAAFTLGTGILMGGAWAYEALSFGGYWAWDPVENMSLVPWLIILAGLHTNLIANATGHAIKSTYVYYWLSFILIIYSTFLTRSGILEDTSAHAFTEMGLEWQLTIFMGVFFLWGLYLIVKNWRKIPSPAAEEHSMSREFWMFIGSLTLLFSGILISFTTSIPVYNKIFELTTYLTGIDMSSYRRTSPTDPVAHYNKYQLWIAVFIAILSAVAVFLRYKLPIQGKILRKNAIYLLVSLVLASVLSLVSAESAGALAWQYKLLLGAAYFALFSNLFYIFDQAIVNSKAWASFSSHIGFAILLFGIMLSGLNKSFISTNRFAQEGLLDGQTEKGLGQNITLLKEVPMFMSGYEVTYLRDSLDGIYREFEILFRKLDEEGGRTDSFTVRPNVLYDRSFTKIAASNPDTKHYLDKDIFTHIHSLPPEQVNIELAQEKEDSLRYETYIMSIGDTLFTSKNYAILEYIGNSTKHPEYIPDSLDMIGGIRLRFMELDSEESWYADPFVLFEEGNVVSFPHQVNPLRTKIRLKESSLIEMFSFTQSDQIEIVDLSLAEKKLNLDDFVINLIEVNPGATHPLYTPQTDDIAIGVKLEILHTLTRKSHQVQPVFVIRGNTIQTFESLFPDANLLIGINKIDPAKEIIQLKYAYKQVDQVKVEIEVAENSARSDFIVLEAIIFPGIIFVWMGSILMLIGLLVAMFLRFKNKINTSS